MSEVADFLRLDSGTETTLLEFIRCDFDENHKVEYKGREWLFPGRPTPGKLTSEAKRGLRKYTTAFANSEGGLLLVGVPGLPPED